MEDCLSYQVLVLNRLWQAVNIVGVKRAFSLLFQDHANVINTAEGDFRVMEPGEWITYSIENPPGANDPAVKTVRYDLRVPKVLLLKSFERLPMKEVKFTRENIFERDNFVCQYCGTQFAFKNLNLDHVIPRDRGGRTSWENIVTSCVRCNTRKANRMPHEAGMRLMRKPSRPRYRPFVSFMVTDEVDPAWRTFLKGVTSDTDA